MAGLVTLSLPCEPSCLAQALSGEGRVSHGWNTDQHGWKNTPAPLAASRSRHLSLGSPIPRALRAPNAKPQAAPRRLSFCLIRVSSVFHPWLTLLQRFNAYSTAARPSFTALS